MTLRVFSGQRPFRVELPRMPKWGRDKVVLALIFVIGCAERLWRLSDNPVALNQDEAVNGYDALCIGQTLRDHHGNFLPLLFESFEDWASPLVTYLTVPFVRVFGLSEFSVRLATATAGCLAIFFMLRLLRELRLGTPAVLAGTAMLALAPWHISLSRWSIPPSTVPTSLLLMAWLAARTQRVDVSPWKAWALFVVAAGVHTYSYPTQKAFAPLWVFVIAVVLTFPRWRRGLAVFAGYLALVAPIYWLTLHDPHRYNARFDKVSLDFHEPGVAWKVLGRYLEYWFSDFHFGRGDTDIMHHVQGIGALSPVVALLFWAGILLVGTRAVGRGETLSELPQRLALVLLAWFVLFPLPASITKDHMHLLRAVHGLPAVIVFASLGLDAILRSVSAVAMRRVLMGAVGVGLVGGSVVFDYLYWGRYRDDAKRDFQYGVRPVFEHALAMQDRYSEVKVRNINQAYIYYLFISKKPPKTLDYDAINLGVVPGEWLNVEKIDHWDFRGYDGKELDGASLVFRVKEDRRTWRRLLEKNGTLYID